MPSFLSRFSLGTIAIAAIAILMSAFALPAIASPSQSLVHGVKTETDSPEITSSAGVAVIGAEKYSETIDVHPGDIIEYQVGIHNTGKEPREKTVMTIELPSQISPRKGSVKMSTPKHEEFYPENDKMITDGVLLRDIAHDKRAYMRFQAQVPGPQLLSCGENTFTATAKVVSDGYTKEHQLTTKVQNNCMSNNKTTPSTSTSQKIPSGYIAIPRWGIPALLLAGGLTTYVVMTIIHMRKRVRRDKVKAT